MIRWIASSLKSMGYALEQWCDREGLSSDDSTQRKASSDTLIPSSYSLVGEVKWAVDHANITQLFTDNGEVTLYNFHFHYVEVAMFTAQVFCHQTGRSKSDIVCVFQPHWRPAKNGYGDNEYLHTSGSLIFKKSDYDAFVEWFDEYKKHFPEDFDWRQILPVIQDGEQVTGYFVDHNCDFDPRRDEPQHDGKFLYIPDDTLFDEWLWMISNTQGVVRILGDKWVFEDSSDAMMYNLQMR